jgi:hypothetical protein
MSHHPARSAAINQAQKFGVEMAIPDEVAALDAEDDVSSQRIVLKLANSERHG